MCFTEPLMERIPERTRFTSTFLVSLPSATRAGSERGLGSAPTRACEECPQMDMYCSQWKLTNNLVSTPGHNVYIGMCVLACYPSPAKCMSSLSHVTVHVCENITIFVSCLFLHKYLCYYNILLIYHAAHSVIKNQQ